ncbi:methylmalonyl-CoA mutase family protein [Alkalihalobacillus sp. BA299]|uniref:methylmalonyl-CoA mutase family protein n=1 Tax=Alkalihalobacillus sp. BA299 TaxID=2815938 RepID=UPI001ADBD5C1|nr:methylmalonyl-CoA mutase family protein [Alkalihalobacillus sp. BA299]
MSSDIENSKKRWEKEVLDPYLEHHPERKARFKNDLNHEIERLYTPKDLEKFNYDYLKDLGFPGEYPFTRGHTPNMYRSETPILRAYSGFGTPEQSNQRYKRLVELGAEEIQVAVDLPTQVGYNSDHIMSTGEVGKVGVAINSLYDMETLFKDVPLNKLRRVGMLGNSFGPAALALFIALGEKQGLKPEEYRVDLQNDILKEYVARGTYVYPIEPSINLTLDTVAYCIENMPHWNPISACVNHINGGGSGSSAGTAIALSNAQHYIENLLERGYHIDQIAPMISMFLDERDDVFTEIANLRATRKIWAEIIRAKYGATTRDAMGLKITAYGHGRETLQEPLNNIVRIALGTLGYFFGGAHSLFNGSYDEAASTPTEESVKIAVRTQQIIYNELGLSNTIDPLGGSYYLESLTCAIKNEIKDYLDEVESNGGPIACIHNGYISKLMTEGAIRRQKEFNEKQRVQVGVNILKDPNLVNETKPFRVDPYAEKQMIESLNFIKSKRSNKNVVKCLNEIKEAALEKENTVPTVLHAIKEYATLGEIADVFRSIYGEYKQKPSF